MFLVKILGGKNKTKMVWQLLILVMFFILFTAYAHNKKPSAYLYPFKTMFMNKFLLAAFLLLTLQSSAQQRLTKDDLTELINRLEGNFDNQEQSQMDKNFSNISLHMKEITFATIKNKPNLKTKTKSKVKTPQKVEGIYVYAEQALMSSPETPFRQWVYFLSRKGDSVISCQVYEMNESLRFAGAWSEPNRLSKLSPDSLIEMTNCVLFFYKNDDGNYVGNTRYKGCENNSKGAVYATSEWTVYPSMIISRERGYDANEKIVWGNEKSGYRYRKFIPLRRKD